MNHKSEKPKPIINCHTHIFTGDQVPPYLARDYVPWPFYYLFPVSFFMSLYKSYRDLKDRIRYDIKYIRARRQYQLLQNFIKRTLLLNLVLWLIGILLTINAFFVIFQWIASFAPPAGTVATVVEEIRTQLKDWYIYFVPKFWLWKILLVLVVILFFKSGRNLIFFALRSIWSWFKMIPGKMSFQLMGRYLLLARYAIHKKQSSIYSKLKGQYPENTGFIVLPMDMKYMGAGPIKCKQDHKNKPPCKDPYYCQLDYLSDILASDKKNQAKKNQERTLYPFVFIDPRRIDDDPDFFKYQLTNGKVELLPCTVKKYIEDEDFSGFKIYPALGYYAFDKRLLPLWLYAAQNDLPIMTHCIKGTIYYRGKKVREWDTHPLFEQVNGPEDYVPLVLPERKGSAYSINFTHPLNYVILLNPFFLKKWLTKLADPDLNDLFGYDPHSGSLERDLNNLKVCFGHFGGEDQWLRFLERERHDHSNQVIRNPDKGIEFVYTLDSLEKGKPKESKGKPEQLWKSVDWYSIITSLMLQHPNVYSDISYIIHDQEIFPLLRYALEHPKLKTRVLFGTDYYVVRNHKSEKSIYVHARAQLEEESFEQIARINPYEFLNLV